MSYASAAAILAQATGAASRQYSDAFPVLLSLQVAGLALLIGAPLGIWLAWRQSRPYRLRVVVDAIVLLPLVLPPTVVGFTLVKLFGRHGPFGGWLRDVFDFSLVFSPAGAVVAATIASVPLLVKTAQPAIEALPKELDHVGRSLGLSGPRLFFRVTLPYAWRGIVAGLVLAFARALGEFGATLMLAGNFPGRTNTMPLEIWAAFQAGDDDRAWLYTIVLAILSLAVVAVASKLTPRRAS